MLLKRKLYNTKIKNIKDKTPSITNLATKFAPDAKINEVKGEIPSNTNLATTAALNTVQNKIPNDGNFVKKADSDANYQ